MIENENLSNLLTRIWRSADSKPQDPALIFPERNETFTFSEVRERTNQVRLQLKALGFQRGDRVLILVPPQPLLFFTLLAAFADGIVPVLIDPRLPLSQWHRALQEAKPKATVIPTSWRWWLRLMPTMWGQPLIAVESLKGSLSRDLELPAIPPQSESLITLTSGTTGKAKLIIRSHSVLAAQQNLACELLPPLKTDRHLAGYPVSILQSLVEGATTFVVSPRNMDTALTTLRQGQVTRLSGPPGFIAQIIEQLSEPIPTVQSVLLGGAPLPDWLLKKILRFFPQAQVHVIYGATEAEPIAFTDASRCLEVARPGYCVGAHVGSLRIIERPFPLTHDPKAFELVIQGDHVASSEPHSTGDIATYTEKGELILLGRKSEAIQTSESTVMPGFLESLLEKHIPQIRRVAVLGQKQNIFVFLELFEGHEVDFELKAKIRALLSSYISSAIHIEPVVKIPVDRRHLWKANKSELRKQFL